MIIRPRCDSCDAPTDNPEDDYGEIICDNCLSNRAEAAWDRQQESLMDGSTPTMREQQLAAWEEHQKAHKR